MVGPVGGSSVAVWDLPLLPPMISEGMAVPGEWIRLMDWFARLRCSEQREGETEAEICLFLHISTAWHRPESHCHLPRWLTQLGWGGQTIFESLSSKPNTACQQCHGPCKVWNCSHSFRARHWTSHNNTAKALIENTKELSWQLLLGVSCNTKSWLI